MSQHAFTTTQAKADVAAAIREVESQTSAEVVVAVRPYAGFYRHTDYLVGFVASFIALLVFLFDSREYALEWMPVDSFLAFLAGALLSANTGWIRRLLTPKKRRNDNARTVARATFVDLGISKTTGRTGILVFVAMFERRVEVVADVGVNPVLLGPAYEGTLRALDESLAGGADFTKFLSALRSLGPILSKTLPRAEDDVNELPDEPVA